MPATIQPPSQILTDDPVLNRIQSLIFATLSRIARMLTSSAGIPQQPWQTVALQNGWVSFGNDLPGYYMDTLGTVHLRGTVRAGTVGSVPIFTLPAGYCPSATLNFPVSSNGAYGQAVVTTTGEVRLPVGSNVYADLVGITFDTRL